MEATGEVATAAAAQPAAEATQPSPTSKYTSSPSTTTSQTPAIDHIRETFGAMGPPLTKFLFQRGLFKLPVDELYIKLQAVHEDVCAHLMKEMEYSQFILCLQEQLMQELTPHYEEDCVALAALISAELLPNQQLFALFSFEYLQAAVYHVLGFSERGNSSAAQHPPQNDEVSSDQLNASDGAGFLQQGSPTLKGSDSPNTSQVCLDFENNRCNRGSSCKYKHITDGSTGRVQLPSTPPAARTVQPTMYKMPSPQQQQPITPQPMVQPALPRQSSPVPPVALHHHHLHHHHQVVHHQVHSPSPLSSTTSSAAGLPNLMTQPPMLPPTGFPMSSTQSSFSSQRPFASQPIQASPQPPVLGNFPSSAVMSFPPARSMIPHAVHHSVHHHQHHGSSQQLPPSPGPGPNNFSLTPPVVHHHHHHMHHALSHHHHPMPLPNQPLQAPSVPQPPQMPQPQQNYQGFPLHSPPSPTPPMALPQPRSLQGPSTQQPAMPPQHLVHHHVHHHHMLSHHHHHHHAPFGTAPNPTTTSTGMPFSGPISIDEEGGLNPHRLPLPQGPPSVPPVIHHHVHHAHHHHHHHVAVHSNSVPRSEEVASEGDSALSKFLDDHQLVTLKPLVTTTTLKELKAYSRNAFEQNLKQRVCSKSMREKLWLALHPDGVGPLSPREQPPSTNSQENSPMMPRQANALAQLKDFAANRSIAFASFSSETSNQSPLTPSQQQGNKPVQVPAPRTVQQMTNVKVLQRQAADTPSSRPTTVDVRAELWLSGTQSMSKSALLDAVSMYGTVVDNGYLKKESAVDHDVMFFKFSGPSP